MLSLLHIENIAVIEQADISFDRGFNVLTGETGAGKSIVIDAISAILGERAYRDMIRTGTNKASVQAVFTDVPELDWFTENGVTYDPETMGGVDFDVALNESYDTPVFRAITNEMLMQLLNAQQITLKQFLEAGSFPFADRLLQMVESNEQQMAQMQAV